MVLTSRGWRVSPVLVFCVLLLAVTVFLLTNPTADSSAVPAPVSRPTPVHAVAHPR